MPDECRLYIGNIPPNMTDELLRQMFEAFGPVALAQVIKDSNGAGAGNGARCMTTNCARHWRPSRSSPTTAPPLHSQA